MLLIRHVAATLTVLIGASCAHAPPPPIAIARGALAYGAAITDDTLVVAELRRDFELVAYSLKTREEMWRREIGPPDYDVTALALDSASSIWVASRDGTVRAYDIRDGSSRLAWRLDSAATAVAVASDYLVTGSESGVLCLRRLDDGALLQCVLEHTSPIADIAVGQNQLATAGANGEIRIWRLPDLYLLHRFQIESAANAVAFADDGRLAIASSRLPTASSRPPTPTKRRSPPDAQAKVILWSKSTGFSTLRGHRDAVIDVIWLDKNTLASASWDRTVREWTIGGKSQIRARFDYIVHDLALGPGIWAISAWALSREHVSTALFVSSRPPSD